jgi:hypothetical protein
MVYYKIRKELLAMSADKRFITALTEKEENILNTFCEKANIKKSQLIRSFIEALEDLEPETTIITIKDGHKARLGRFIRETKIVRGKVQNGKCALHFERFNKQD